VRSLFLITGTNEVLKYADSLRILNHGSVDVLRYDELSSSDQVLWGKIREAKPDFVVYIGSRWGKQPSISCLSQINEKIAPMVHLCSDAADPPWFDLLRDYHSAGCFSLQIAIDGSHKWPLSSTQMTALTPVDPASFPLGLRPHEERGIRAGYGGNAGGGPGTKRTDFLAAMLQERALDMRGRTNLPHTYDAYCDFLQNCRMSFNTSFSGTEAALQVKGRVVESGLAGALLLETKGAPTSYWFRPGIDYLEYESPENAVSIIRQLSERPDETQRMAFSLRERVLAAHTPAHFWAQVLDRIGMKMAA
jgi:hypothetical protein